MNPTMTNQGLVKDAHSLKHSGFHRVRARGLTPPCQANERPRLPITLWSRTHISALEGVHYPSKALGATPGRCARAHPPEKSFRTQNNSLISKPLKE
jgi:hypothetical protein